jgi:hypothetical protein
MYGDKCMKKCVFYIILILFPIFYSFSSEFPTVKQIQGKVEIKNDSTGSRWVKAFKGMEIKSGALISTGFKSNAVIELDNSEIFIKQLTRMTIEDLSRKNNTVKTNLNLRLGRISADVKTSKGLKHDFIVRTPVSTAAVRGTIFDAGIGKLEVKNGIISFTNKIGQKVTVGGGKSSEVGGDGYSTPENTGDTILKDFNIETSTHSETGSGITTGTGDNIKYGSIELVFNWDMGD